MEPQRWARVDEVFGEAVELNETERVAYLERACGDDPELRAEVESLLVNAIGANDGLHRAIAAAADRYASTTAQPLIGRRIGPWKLVEFLGEGGMGVVYRAERDDAQYQRVVALKIIQHGLGSSEAVARFRDERQILAALDHPGIVRLIDGGATEEGLPYLVMELVAGVPITRYLREHAPGIRARVELVRRVCAAVQYAHEHRVVHRDIKPSNILVAVDGSPKLLDFGIAKMLDPEASEAREARTRTGVALLTPEYASPEQARGEAVTFATDVYSLGAVLYEVMTGKPPQRPAGSALEMVHSICEIEPPHPSKVAPTEISRAIGDLDTIIMKALRKEPARRYASIAELADDLGRYLDGLPVTARRGSWSYRSRRFVRRHRRKLALVLAAGASASVVAIAVGESAESRKRESSYEVRRLPLQLDGTTIRSVLSANGRSMFYQDHAGWWQHDLAAGTTEHLDLVVANPIHVEPMPDGRLLVASGAANTELVVPRTRGHHHVVSAGFASLSPDGTRLAAWADRTLIVHELATGKSHNLHTVIHGVISSPPRWSPDGESLVWGRSGVDTAVHDGPTFLTSVRDGTTSSLGRGALALGARIKTDYFDSVDFLPDGRLVYCSDTPLAVSARAPTGGPSEILAELDEGVSDCTFSVRGDRIAGAISYSHHTLGLLSLASANVMRQVAGPTPLEPAAVTSTHAFAYADPDHATMKPRGSIPQLRSIALATGAIENLASCRDEATVVNRGDELLHVSVATTKSALLVQFRRAVSCELVGEWPLPADATLGKPVCSAHLCAIAAWFPDRVMIWKLAPGEAPTEIYRGDPDSGGSYGPGIAISPGNDTIAILPGWSSSPRLIDVANGTATPLSLPGGPAFGLAWIRNPDRLVVSTQDYETVKFAIVAVDRDGKRELLWSSEKNTVLRILVDPASRVVIAKVQAWRQEFLILDRK